MISLVDRRAVQAKITDAKNHKKKLKDLIKAIENATREYSSLPEKDRARDIERLYHERTVYALESEWRYLKQEKEITSKSLQHLACELQRGQDMKHKKFDLDPSTCIEALSQIDAVMSSCDDYAKSIEKKLMAYSVDARAGADRGDIKQKEDTTIRKHPAVTLTRTRSGKQVESLQSRDATPSRRTEPAMTSLKLEHPSPPSPHPKVIPDSCAGHKGVAFSSPVDIQPLATDLGPSMKQSISEDHKDENITNGNPWTAQEPSLVSSFMNKLSMSAKKNGKVKSEDVHIRKLGESDGDEQQQVSTQTGSQHNPRVYTNIKTHPKSYETDDTVPPVVLPRPPHLHVPTSVSGAAGRVQDGVYVIPDARDRGSYNYHHQCGTRRKTRVSKCVGSDPVYKSTLGTQVTVTPVRKAEIATATSPQPQEKSGTATVTTTPGKKSVTTKGHGQRGLSSGGAMTSDEAGTRESYYTLNDRLFPTPVPMVFDNKEVLPITHTPNDEYIKWSVPVHALLPTKKPQPHRRRSVGSSNEYSLSQNIEKGLEAQSSIKVAPSKVVNNESINVNNATKNKAFANREIRQHFQMENVNGWKDGVLTKLTSAPADAK